jgi:hypothetical protein
LHCLPARLPLPSNKSFDKSILSLDHTFNLQYPTSIGQQSCTSPRSPPSWLVFHWCVTLPPRPKPDYLRSLLTIVGGRSLLLPSRRSASLATTVSLSVVKSMAMLLRRLAQLRKSGLRSRLATRRLSSILPLLTSTRTRSVTRFAFLAFPAL